MADLVTIRGYVTDILGLPAGKIANASLNLLINFAQRSLVRHYDIRYAEATSTFTMVQGTQSYALPALFSRAYQFWYINPDTNGLAQPELCTRQFFIENFAVVATQGDPSNVAIYGVNALFGPTPKRALSIFMDHYVLPTDLVADADHNGITDNLYELLTFQACVNATEYLIDDDRAGLWASERDRLLAECLGEASRGRHMALPFPQMSEPG